MNKREIGTCYEQKAADYLREKGLTIIAYNYRCRMGEIDLIELDERAHVMGDHEKTCVFIEVKYRKSAKSGQPWEAVDHKKRKTIFRVAEHYRLTHGGLSNMNFRFDVISILDDQITWFPNAFSCQ